MKDHRVLYCRSKLTCRRCNRKHKKLLHEEKENTSKSTLSSPGSSAENLQPEEKPSIRAASKASELMSRSILKVVPVKMWTENPKDFTHTYAFFDEGSNANLCVASLARRLGVPLAAANVELVTTNATSQMKKKVNRLAVQGCGERHPSG